MFKCAFVFVVITNIFKVTTEQGMTLVGNPLVHAHPCNGTTTVTLSHESNLPPEEENQYAVYMDLSQYGQLSRNTKIKIKLDADATMETTGNGFFRLNSYPGGRFHLQAYKAPPLAFSLLVKGKPGGPVPNIESIDINGIEHCKNPLKGIFDGIIQGESNSASSNIKPPLQVSNCGRRFVQHTELITHSAPTKPGDWPWHAALFRAISKGLTQKYICGGTLVSKNIVVTASHCVTLNGIPVIPETLKIVLGKYKLGGGDRDVQEMNVFEVIVHPAYEKRYLSNDIALLRLASEAVFTDYVQPVCIWDSTDTGISSLIGKLGTVVGWGIDETDALTDELAQASIPIVSDSTCLRSLASFFDKFLRDTTYCAGFRNGTSVCNGDSGGGMVFPIEMTPGDEGSKTWFLRGVVSVSVSRSSVARCDPNHYVVFTDAAKYGNWITLYVNNNKNKN